MCICMCRMDMYIGVCTYVYVKARKLMSDVFSTFFTEAGTLIEPECCLLDPFSVYLSVYLSQYFVCLFIETGFLCVALTILELALQTRLILNSEICLPLLPEFWD